MHWLSTFFHHWLQGHLLAFRPLSWYLWLVPYMNMQFICALSHSAYRSSTLEILMSKTLRETHVLRCFHTNRDRPIPIHRSLKWLQYPMASVSWCSMNTSVQFSAQNWPNNKLVPPPPRIGIPSEKFWIGHCTPHNSIQAILYQFLHRTRSPLVWTLANDLTESKLLSPVHIFAINYTVFPMGFETPWRSKLINRPWSFRVTISELTCYIGSSAHFTHT